MVEHMRDIVFRGVNTKFAESIMRENEPMMTEGMDDLQKAAYKLGVENTFSILNQLWKESLDGETVLFYNPDILKSEMEYTEEELIGWLNNRDI